MSAEEEHSTYNPEGNVDNDFPSHVDQEEQEQTEQGIKSKPQHFNTISDSDRNTIKRKTYGDLPPLKNERGEINNPFLPAPSNQRWVFDPDFSDEFHPGLLDEQKWIINNPTWRGRLPSWFKRDNVFIYQSDKRTGDHALYLRSREDDAPENIRKEGHHSFSTSFVRTRKTRLYGYFEIVCKLMDSEISSAFWFSNPSGWWWTELDVFEYSTTTKKKTGKKKDLPFNQQFATNYFVHRHPDPKVPRISIPRRYDIGFDLSEKRIKVGFNWQKDYIEWYLNDVLIRRDENKYFHQPLHMQFDSETFPTWFGLPTIGDNSLPKEFKIMYARTWFLDDVNYS